MQRTDQFETPTILLVTPPLTNSPTVRQRLALHIKRHWQHLSLTNYVINITICGRVIARWSQTRTFYVAVTVRLQIERLIDS